MHDQEPANSLRRRLLAGGAGALASSVMGRSLAQSASPEMPFPPCHRTTPAYPKKRPLTLFSTLPPQLKTSSSAHTAAAAPPHVPDACLADLHPQRRPRATAVDPRVR